MRIFTIFVFCFGIANASYAAAPVIDDSENYAVFKSEGEQHSSSHHPIQQYASNEEEPLVKSMPKDESGAQQSLTSQINSMQQEIQALRGELEVQAHAIETLKHKLNKVTVQSATTNTQPKPAVPASLKDAVVTSTHTTNSHEAKKTTDNPILKPQVFDPTPNSKNPADEQVAYLAAYDLVKSKRYNEALTAMENFVKQYPRSGYTANAEYWIGELFLARNMPAQALQHFENVLSQYPHSSKAAASALKIGYALAAMGQREEASSRLKDVIKKYPDTTAAQLAKTKLDSL